MVIMDERTKILKLTETRGGARLTITGEEEPLLVSLDTVHRHRLVEGIVLTQAQVGTLHEEAAMFQCDHLTARYLAMRDHSVGELKAKLRRRQFSPQIVASTIKKYLENGALDDARYAMIVGASLLKRRPCGRGYLCAYLQKRKIARDLADQTAETLLTHEDDTELATTALEQRWSRFGQLELETARTKAYNYLARRGFGYQSARTAFARLWQKTNEGPEDQDF